jgi:DNA recombination protein RmuC
MQTGQLASALHTPQVRGLWGEVALQRVAELAGMSQHCDFETQVSEGDVRPDMVVRLAGGRNIVVDAKVPMAAYLAASRASGPDDAAGYLDQHASQLRAHIDQLAAKKYWASFDQAPEFVVLFLPGDPLLDAALAADPALLEYGFRRNVIMTTPATLIALLRTVALTWRQDALTREVATVQQLGRELYTRLGTAGRHLDSLGSQLGKAVESFNKTVASMESRVLVTARKLHDIDGGETEPVTVAQVETFPRAVALDRLASASGPAQEGADEPSDRVRA